MNEQSVTSRPGLAAGAVLVIGCVTGAAAWSTTLSYGFADRRYPVWQIVAAVVAVIAAVAISRVLARGRAAWATVVGVTAGYGRELRTLGP